MLRKSAFGFLALGLGWVAATGASHAGDLREFKDVTGVTVKLPDQPKRVVTLMPSLGEIAAQILGDNIGRIIGVSEYTDHPPALTAVKVVGPYAHFNLEQVANLKPDLILASRDGNPKDQVDHLREIGLPVVVVDTENFGQVERSMRQIAEALGESDRGKKLADLFADRLSAIRARAAARARKGLKPEKVLIQLNADPLITVGSGAFLQDALEAVGAQNLYADQKARYPRASVEDVVNRSPDVILVFALGKDRAPFEAMAAAWKQFSKIPAVRNRRIEVLQADPIVRPSLRLLEGLSLLEKAIYGRGTGSENAAPSSRS